MDALEQLQEWYLAQCDEDWEESYGVTIETLDNPGWKLKIDIVDSALDGLTLPFRRVDRSETDWIQSESDGVLYKACGGAMNLTEMIEAFIVHARAAR